MNYPEHLNTLLIPKPHLPYRVLDLFAGCGGLSLGFESAGFQTVGYEIDQQAVATYNQNLTGTCYQQQLTSHTTFPSDVDLIIGGPPCQPFSVGGHQKGVTDARNGFPAFFQAIRQLQPPFWLFENVRGMLYANRWYLEQLIQELTQLGYLIEYQLLNAVHFGVPQNRERLFVVGYQQGRFHFPRPESSQRTVGEAIGDLIDTIQDDRKILTPAMDKYVANYERASQCLNPRDLHLDKPARTLTCRNIAAPTGDMQRVKLKDGRRRRISVREAARLQSFPDSFNFCGTETQQYYQIGNAVSPLLAWHLAKAVREYFERGKFDITSSPKTSLPPVQRGLF